MKKCLLIFICLFITSTYCYSYTPSNSDILIINKVHKNFIKKNTTKQIKLITQINTIVRKKRLSSRVKYILQSVSQKLKNHNLYSSDDSEKQSEKNIQKFNLDIDQIRWEWIWYVNKTRKSYRVPLYSYDKRLDYISQLWSNQWFSRGKITHQVDIWDSFYDYAKKEAWVKDKWIVCTNKSRATFSESIAWWDIYCDGKNDCQKQLSDSVKWVFKFFMDEKGLPYPDDAHYRGIVHKDFKKMWLAFTLKHKEGNWYSYYMTNYYCTEIK